MVKYKVAIIGGGATGLLLANLLSKDKFDIYVIEKNNKLGKKILASGNGKCNFTNINVKENNYNNEFALKIVNRYNSNKTISLFKKLGMLSKIDSEGRCYPYSESSNTVLDCLKEKLNYVKFMLDTEVKCIEKENNKYKLLCNKEYIIFDYVICCSGSLASNLGSEKAYNYLSQLDIKTTSLKPSLVPLLVKEDISGLKGVRVKCKITLENSKNDIVYEEDGEVMFKDDALSGIAVFNASSYINREKENYKIILDLFPGMESYELEKYLLEKYKMKLSLLKGLINDKLADYIYSKNFVKEEKEMSINQIKEVVKSLKYLEFLVTGSYPFKEAQVCSGGICVQEVTDNLELKKYPNVYVGGELLDVDGVCGGYNLQFAWSSAMIVANNINLKVGINGEK